MSNYGEIARAVVKKNIGMARYEEICTKFGLDRAGRELLDKLLGEWRPDYGIQDVVETVGRYKGYSNVELVWSALELMTRESTEISTRRRFQDQRRDS